MISSGPPLIALDGMDGAGKTTQQTRLIRQLETEFSWRVASRNLGSTPRFRETLRSLQGGALEASPKIRELVYYFEALFAYLEQSADLSGYDAVVADRYYLTYRVYGQLNGWDRDDILFFTKYLPPPAVYVVLDLPPECAADRIAQTRTFHRPELGYRVLPEGSQRAQFLEYQTKVRKLFLAEAGSQATVLDARRPEAELTESILGLVRRQRRGAL